MKNKIISLSFAFAVATSSSFAIAMEQNVETVEQTTVQTQPAKPEEKKDSPLRRILFFLLHANAFFCGPSLASGGAYGFMYSVAAGEPILAVVSGGVTVGGVALTIYGAQGLYKDFLGVVKDIKNA